MIMLKWEKLVQQIKPCLIIKVQFKVFNSSVEALTQRYQAVDLSVSLVRKMIGQPASHILMLNLSFPNRLGDE